MKLVILSGTLKVNQISNTAFNVTGGELIVRMSEEDDAFGISQIHKQLQLALDVSTKTMKKAKKMKDSKYTGTLNAPHKMPI